MQHLLTWAHFQNGGFCCLFNTPAAAAQEAGHAPCIQGPIGNNGNQLKLSQKASAAYCRGLHPRKTAACLGRIHVSPWPPAGRATSGAGDPLMRTGHTYETYVCVASSGWVFAHRDGHSRVHNTRRQREPAAGHSLPARRPTSEARQAPPSLSNSRLAPPIRT